MTNDPCLGRSRIKTADEVGYFDPAAPITVLDGNLPHFRQDGVTYFVTFRTADSLPKEKLTMWLGEREMWLAAHPEPHTPQQKREYFEMFPERLQYWLDAGYGNCWLGRTDARKVVVDALNHFAGERYLLRDWVVMPNHVHAIVTPLAGFELSKILHSWKSFTANVINKLLNRKGIFWQKESFDHVLRNAESLERIEKYIRENPLHLPPGTFSLSPPR